MTPAVGSAGRLPDLLVIGAMKSGTTTLHSLLAQHPGLFMSEQKEPGFFSRDERYGQGLPAYMDLFRAARPEQLCGESSTCYSRWPHYPNAAPRIAEHLPNAKFVFLMRHPIERMYSHYMHRMTERFHRNTGKIVSFEQGIQEIPEIRDASLYALQLEKFLEHFPREKFLLLATAQLEEDPVGTVERVHGFLGLPPVPPASLHASNRSGSKFAAETGDRYFKALRNTALAGAVARLLPDSLKVTARRGIKQVLSRATANHDREEYKRQIGPLSPEFRRRLLADFEEPNRRLEEIWGQPVPASWNE